MITGPINSRSRLNAQVRYLPAMMPQASTCADVSPVKEPGVKFACPSDTEFNPAMAEAVVPRAKSCCKVREGRQLSTYHASSVLQTALAPHAAAASGHSGPFNIDSLDTWVFMCLCTLMQLLAPSLSACECIQCIQCFHCIHCL